MTASLLRPSLWSANRSCSGDLPGLGCCEIGAPALSPYLEWVMGAPRWLSRLLGAGGLKTATSVLRLKTICLLGVIKKTVSIFLCLVTSIWYSKICLVNNFVS